MSIINSLVFVSLFSPVFSQSLTEDTSGDFYYKKGLLQYRAGMYDFCIFSMERALEKNHDLFEAANILAEIYIIKNDKQKAIEYYRKSLEASDSQSDIHNAIAGLYEFYNDRDKAFGHYRKAVSINKNHLRANLNLVRFYLIEKRKDLADLHFNLSAEEGEKLTANIFAAAVKETESGNLKKALELYEETLKKNPAKIEAYIAASDIYRKFSRYDRAARILEDLKFLKPDCEMAYVYLGNIYSTGKFPGVRKKYFIMAIKNLNKALDLNPRNSDTCYSLSKVYELIGEKDKSIEMENRARKLEDE